MSSCWAGGPAPGAQSAETAKTPGTSATSTTSGPNWPVTSPRYRWTPPRRLQLAGRLERQIAVRDGGGELTRRRIHDLDTAAPQHRRQAAARLHGAFGCGGGIDGPDAAPRPG